MSTVRQPAGRADNDDAGDAEAAGCRAGAGDGPDELLNAISRSLAVCHALRKLPCHIKYRICHFAAHRDSRSAMLESKCSLQWPMQHFTQEADQVRFRVPRYYNGTANFCYLISASFFAIAQSFTRPASSLEMANFDDMRLSIYAMLSRLTHQSIYRRASLHTYLSKSMLSHSYFDTGAILTYI